LAEQRSQLIGKVETSARPDLKQHGESLDGCVRHVKPGSDESSGTIASIGIEGGTFPSFTAATTASRHFLCAALAAALDP
jgi:hypothetical protein